MKKLLFLVFLLSVSFAYSQHLVQPDTLWTYGPANFTSYPAVHPNGNVIVRVNADVIELNGFTGQVMRSIYIPSNDYNNRIQISSDGTRIIVGDYLVDFETGELIKQIGALYPASFLHPSNDVIIYLNPNAYQHIDSNLIIYNLMTGNKYYVNTVDFPTALAVSNDGKYLAVGCWDYETDRTHFSLYDAQTLKPIRELEDVPSTGRRIEFIQFSETAKYVGYGSVSSGNAKATFFSCPEPNIKKEFNNYALGLASDRYAFVCFGGAFLWDIDLGKEIYRTSYYGSYYPIYNKINNSLIVYSLDVKLAALDLDAILTGVDVSDKPNPEGNLSISYLNGYLHIGYIEPSALPNDIKLYDLNGKITFQAAKQIIEDSLQIRIDLQSGVYILQIQAGDKQYSQKFIIIE
jgi:WD40 repeat protein